MEIQTVYIGADHGGVELKTELLADLKRSFPTIDFQDVGTHDSESVDYPDYARLVARKVAAENARGILICGSGIGMSMVANRFAKVRAALVWDVTSARLSREHNDSNVICLGARLVGRQVAIDCIHIWLETAFQGGRHDKRVKKIDEEGANV